jgi:hypothetical protein
MAVSKEPLNNVTMPPYSHFQITTFSNFQITSQDLTILAGYYFPSRGIHGCRPAF